MTAEIESLRLSILACQTCGEYTEKTVKKTGEVKRTPVVKIPKGKVPLTESSSNPVPGSGPEDAEFLWIGEAPGEDEDSEGEPFIGRSGRYLKQRLITQLAGIRLKQCRFTNIVKCHPLDNRDPVASEIKACYPWLETEIRLINPKVIFTVGRIATRVITGEVLKTTHGQVLERDGRLVIPLYHPAAVDRSVPRKVLERDYKLIREKIKAAAPTGELSRPEGEKYHLVDTAQDFANLFNRMNEYSSFAFDIETDEEEWVRKRKKDVVDPLTNVVVGLSISLEEGEGYYIPLRTDRRRKDFLGLLKQHFRRCEVIMHNAKFEMKSLEKYGIRFKKVFCTLLAAYALGEETLGLKDIVRRNFGVTMTELDELADIVKNPVSSIPLAKLYPYGCADSDFTLRYANIARRQLDGSLSAIWYYDIALKLLPWAVGEELEGIEIDEDRRLEIDEWFKKELAKLEDTIHELAGEDFNINSSDQKAEILFEVLEGIPETKMTTGGKHPSTNKDDLRPLAGINPIIKPMLEHSSLSTVRSNFVVGLPKRVHPETHRLHASINQTGTETSRFSYSNPNWQNLPVRRPETKVIRELVIPDEVGWYIVAIDQSQIELRWAAHLSKDRWMIEQFRNNISIHAEVCKFVYEVDEDHPNWFYLYKNSKNGDFARLFGATEYKLMETLECSLVKARAFLEGHRALMSDFELWTKEQKKIARRLGYVETHQGYRRYIPEIQSQNRKQRSKGERLAINTPIQGSAAGMIQMAMVQIAREFKRKRLASRMIIQVHDELIFSVPEEEVPVVVEIATNILESVVELEIETPVAVEIGPSWGRLQSFTDWEAGH